MTQLTKTDDYELDYHIVPPKGLLNDPNGLIQFKGTYHVFFQWNPYETTHSSKSWGHVTSTDLVHWEYQKTALEPVDWFDKNGCYSGSAVSADDKIWLFYTGNVRNEDGDRESYQCLAISEDGIHFEKKGPILKNPAGYTAHIRDPKVWQDSKGIWWMILGAQKEDLTGDTIVYRSENLTKWEFVGSLMEDLPGFGYMWECPDLLRLNEKDVFVFSPQGLEAKGDEFRNIFQTGYVTGTFEDGKFRQDGQSFQEMDRGFEFYAPQTFENDQKRTILFGWMGTMEPEVEKAVPTREQGWIHALTIPREVTFEQGKLIQRPVPELQQMRTGNPVLLADSSETGTSELPSLTSEILVSFEEQVQYVDVQIRKDIQIDYRSEDQRLVVSRTNWLTQQREERAVRLEQGLNSLQLFLDRSSLEMFVNDGEEVFSLRFFIEPEEKSFQISSDRPNKQKVQIFTLNTKS